MDHDGVLRQRQHDSVRTGPNLSDEEQNQTTDLRGTSWVSLPPTMLSPSPDRPLQISRTVSCPGTTAQQDGSEEEEEAAEEEEEAADEESTSSEAQTISGFIRTTDPVGARPESQFYTKSHRFSELGRLLFCKIHFIMN